MTARRSSSPRAGAQRGTSLVEAVSAIALAAVLLANVAQATGAAAAVLQRSRAVSDTLDATRALMEHELGAPCGPRPACPAGATCTVARHALTATVERVVVTVSLDDGSGREELVTLAPVPACRAG